MRTRVMIMAAYFAFTGEVAAQTICPCGSEKAQHVEDSSRVELTHYRCGYQGLTKKQVRQFNKCAGLDPGRPVVLGQAFRDALCECSPKRMCFKQLMIAVISASEPPTLLLTFEKP